MTADKKIVRALPEHGACFVCGSANPNSMGVKWQILEDESIVTKVTLSLAQQGPPGFAHGGASAALLDEAMGTSVWVAGYQVVAVNLQVEYLRPLPLHQPISVSGWVEGQEGRAVHARGEICLPDGTPAVAGHGIYVEAPQFFDEMWKHIKGQKKD